MNGIALGKCPNALRKEFYESYRNDKEFISNHGVLCTHATSMCELFMPFNINLIAIASTRFEIGRHSAAKWQQWIDNLQLIASRPGNIVAANNRYDQEYIKYFTNISTVQLLPSYCGYITSRYSYRTNDSSSIQRHQILIGPARGVNVQLSKELESQLSGHHSTIHGSTFSTATTTTSQQLRGDNSPKRRHLELAHIRDLYPNHFEYDDIASHPAMIFLPYQVSVMSFFEFYRMCLPIFVPSPELLAQWHLSLGVLNERTWPSVFGMPVERSVLPKHRQSTSNMLHDPNNDMSYDAVLEWLRLADFYQWPHITQFSSWEELFKLLRVTDLAAISQAMCAHNTAEAARIELLWQQVLTTVEQHPHNLALVNSNDSAQSLNDLSVNEALLKNYGYQLADDCDGQVYSHD